MMGTKILVVDDEISICELLRTYFENEGYEVKTASDGTEGITFFKMYEPDLVLLDIMLPRKDGWQVCREIREISSKPIIMISAKGEVFDKVLGLELGADDYVVKPFGAHELLARVRVLLRRRKVPPSAPGRTTDVFRLGDCIVNGRELSIVGAQGGRVGISARECALIRYFAAHPHEVASRKELFEYAWGPGAYAYSRTLDTHVCSIRHKISGSGWSIDAVTGLGYRLRRSRAGS